MQVECNASLKAIKSCLRSDIKPSFPKELPYWTLCLRGEGNKL